MSEAPLTTDTVRHAFIDYVDAASVADGVARPSAVASGKAFDLWLSEAVAAALSSVAEGVAEGLEQFVAAFTNAAFTNAAALLIASSADSAALAAERGERSAQAAGDTT